MPFMKAKIRSWRFLPNFCRSQFSILLTPTCFFVFGKIIEVFSRLEVLEDVKFGPILKQTKDSTFQESG